MGMGIDGAHPDATERPALRCGLLPFQEKDRPDDFERGIRLNHPHAELEQALFWAFFGMED